MYLRKGWNINPILGCVGAILPTGLDGGEASHLEPVRQVAASVRFDGREVMTCFKLRGSTSSKIWPGEGDPGKRSLRAASYDFIVQTN